MTISNVAPSMAQVASNVTVSFSNQGGYNVEYFVSGQVKNFNGQVLRNLTTFQSPNMLLGQKQAVSFPLTMQEIRQGGVRVVTVTGRMSHNRQVFIQKDFRLDSNICFFNDQTIFNPRGHFRPGTC
jgi:maltodextrin utilization protein YvdJ